MIRNIWTLTLNDLAIAIKNKTIFLIFFIPLFVFFTLKMVDTKNVEFKKLNFGIVRSETYSPVVLKSIRASDRIFNIVDLDSIDVGKELVKEKKLDGLLLKNEELIVLKKESLKTLSMIESMHALQQAVEGRKNWVSNVTPLQTTDIQKESLPTWILMLVLLVGFVIMPSQVAEEKEKRLLVSLLQTPMREIEWLMAKAITGMILTIASVGMLHLMGNFKLGFNFSYITILLLGSFCFSSYGILLGFLCRNQASARILGVIFYLPHLLPSALSDFSSKLDGVAPLLPSYHFYESIKKIIFDHGTLSGFGSLYLILIGTVTFMISYVLMRKRWLM